MLWLLRCEEIAFVKKNPFQNTHVIGKLKYIVSDWFYPHSDQNAKSKASKDCWTQEEGCKHQKPLRWGTVPQKGQNSERLQQDWNTGQVRLLYQVRGAHHARRSWNCIKYEVFFHLLILSLWFSKGSTWRLSTTSLKANSRRPPLPHLKTWSLGSCCPMIWWGRCTSTPATFR